MRRVLLIAAILLFLAAALALLAGALFLYGYYHVLDGGPGLLPRPMRQAVTGFVCSGIGAVLGIICLILRGRI